MSRIIFELKLTNEDSILATEINKYDSYYFDSELYLIINNKRSKIVNHSFCYGFGAEMYYRINNINEFSESHNFVRFLEDDCNSQSFDLYENFIFANGSHNKELFLLKNNNEYKLLYVQLKQKQLNGIYKAKILKEYNISSSFILEWKKIIEQEFEKRAKIEGEKISRKKYSDEEWNGYFNQMKT